jgi:hypothetical protein
MIPAIGQRWQVKNSSIKEIIEISTITVDGIHGTVLWSSTKSGYKKTSFYWIWRFKENPDTAQCYLVYLPNQDKQQ